MANILGIDYGKKYIGYAIGNDITLTSSTKGTIIYKNQKKCSSCLKKLPFNYFSKNRHQEMGLSKICLACEKNNLC